MKKFARNVKHKGSVDGVVQHLPLGVAHLVKGVLAYVNPAFSEYHGLDVESMTGAFWLDHVHSQYREVINNGIGWSAASNGPWSGAIELLSGPLQTTLLCTIRAISDDEAVIGLAKTSDLQVTSGIQQNELAYVRDALLATAQGYWQWDLETDELVMHGPFLRELGYDTETIMPLTMDWLFERIQSEDLRRAETSFEQYAQHAQPEWKTDVRVRSSDDQLLWTSIRGRFVRWNNHGQPCVMAGTIMNVHDTYLERASADLARNTLKAISAACEDARGSGGITHILMVLLQRMMESVSADHGTVLDVITRVDGSSVCRVVADASTSAAYVPVTDNHWHELPDDAQHLLTVATLSAVPWDGAGNERFPITMTSTIQQLFVMHDIHDVQSATIARAGSVILLRGPSFNELAVSNDQAVAACRSVCFALLSQHRAQSAVSAEAVSATKRDTIISSYAVGRVARLQETLMATVSHELRQPLSTIVTATEAIMAGVYGEVQPAQLLRLHDVHVSGLHMMSLLNDILDASKARQGRLIGRMKPCSIGPVVESAIKMMQAMAEQKSIRLAVDTSNLSDVIVQADERRLQQMFINLLSNAIKFTPNWGDIRVRSELAADETSVIVSIQDTGVGIRADELPNLFEPYWQRPSDEHRVGTGLGLPIAQYIVDQHGGIIEVQSEPNKGSTFSVRLPWKQLERSSQQPDNNDPHHNDHRRSILIIDTNAMYASHIAHMLEMHGCRVVMTGSKHNGLRTLSNERFDIVVMAVDLQGTDDLEMIRSIDVVTRSHAMNTALIATSVMIMPGDTEICMAAGASRLVSKHTSSELVRAIIPRT